MKVSRFTEEEILNALRENEAGKKVGDISMVLGISIGTFYQWRKKYGNEEAKRSRQIRSLRTENEKLKRMYAEQALRLERAMEELEKSQ